jgi:hypothetical protein
LRWARERAWLALAAGTTVAVDRLRQNTKYQAISFYRRDDQLRGAAALGVVPLTASR